MPSKIFLAGLILSAVATLGGCANYSKIDTLGPTVEEISKLPVSDAAQFIADKSIMTYQGEQRVCSSYYVIGTTYVPNCYSQPGHGTQIEYFGSDGRAFLWYPGNSRIVPALWELRPGTLSHSICFKYSKRSYNPLTKQDGSRWNCISLGHWAKDIVEKRSGDIFKLSTGRVPHPLPRYQTTFDTLLKQ